MECSIYNIHHISFYLYCFQLNRHIPVLHLGLLKNLILHNIIYYILQNLHTKYLYKDISYEDFVEYNKLYCAVSGSLISPNAVPEYVYLTENNTGKKICGEYYRCCIPCSCDLMKYSKTTKMKHKFKGIEKEFYVFTIENPCGKTDFPERVNKKYFCNGNDLDTKQVSVVDGKLVIGLLHKAKTCTQYNVNAIDRHQVTGRYCTLRNNTPLDQLQSGMGDIFIKLAR